MKRLLTQIPVAAVVAMLAFALAAPVLVRAQALDLSGTWAFDEEESDPPPQRRRGGGGRGGGFGGGRGGGFGGRGRGGAVANQLVIIQTPAELSVERTTAQGVRTVAYPLDGSEVTISGGFADTTATAMVESATVVIRTSRSFEGPNGAITISGKDVYSVNGDALTLERTTETPFGSNTRKLVYNKQ